MALSPTSKKVCLRSSPSQTVVSEARAIRSTTVERTCSAVKQRKSSVLKTCDTREEQAKKQRLFEFQECIRIAGLSRNCE